MSRGNDELANQVGNPGTGKSAYVILSPGKDLKEHPPSPVAEILRCAQDDMLVTGFDR